MEIMVLNESPRPKGNAAALIVPFREGAVGSWRPAPLLQAGTETAPAGTKAPGASL